MTFKKNLLARLLILLAFAFTGCATTDGPELSEEELYKSASDALKSRNFREATRQLEALEARYPFGRFAEQSQLELIYARYASLDLEGSKAAANRFIRLHPTSENVDYAYYMRGLAAYNTDGGLAAQWFPIDSSSRDPGEMRAAFADFAQLVNRYPESPYAADARQRMLNVRNRLADYELHAARYYIRREAYLAAANRARQVVEGYPQTPAAETGLIFMVELYRKLGMPTHADDALAVLAASFPESAAFDKKMRFKSNLVKTEDRSLAGLFTLDIFNDE
jgi:outer membrane protein assembly factor BamD